MSHAFGDRRPGRGRRRPVRIAGYRSYGTSDRVFVRGRVLADDPIPRSRPEDRWWRNLRSTWRRMKSDEVSDAKVAIRFRGSETLANADPEGHVHTWIVPDDPPPAASLWHPARIAVVHPEPENPVALDVPVLVPPPTARYGVISDIDDTVVRADVANLVRLVADVVFGSAHTRMPFPGVAAFFRALHRGVHGRATNPVFYVSNGPWNLYDAFIHFLELHEIPVGPVELRDWGPLWDEARRIGRREDKTAAVERIFETIPDLPFLLVGDSGELDPEIYRDIVHRFPARVPAVYIRDVSRDPLRKKEIADLAAEVESAGSALVLAKDTAAAARHAADHGWIEPASLAAIEIDRAHDAHGGERGRGVVVEGGEEREV